MNPQGHTLIVKAGVRYWEDATVNGVVDEDGTLIPFRKGDLWCPVIELKSGQVLNWPQGTTADIHYKVCDSGSYWIGDMHGDPLFVWNSDYVPDDLLASRGGYGDYIILEIDACGMIKGWRAPLLNPEQWDSVQ